MTLPPLKPLSPAMQVRYREQAELLMQFVVSADKLAEALMTAHQIGYSIGRYAQSLEEDAAK